MSMQLMICVVICIFTAIGFVSNKMSFGTTACCAMVLFLLTGCIKPAEALGNLGNSNMILVASMLVISAGFSRTQAVKFVGQTVKAISKGSIYKIMFGFTLASILAATFTGSAAAAFCIMAPIVQATCKETGISISKVTFCVGLTCIAACGIIPVGGTLAMYSELNGYITANDYEQFQLNVMDMFIGKWPTLVALIIYCTFFGHRIAPEQPLAGVGDTSELEAKNIKRPALPPFQEKCGYIIFIMVSVALIFGTQITGFFRGFDIAFQSWEIVFIGALLMVVTGVLTPKDAFGSINWDLCMLIAGSLCIGAALNNTGGGVLIGDAIASVANTLHNPYLIGAMFFLVPFALTQVMQNRAVMAIFQPIAILACKSMGVSCVGPVLLVSAACCTAFMTPSATACIPMIMGVGGYDIRRQFVQSIIPAIILSIVNIFWVMTVYTF